MSHPPSIARRRLLALLPALASLPSGSYAAARRPAPAVGTFSIVAADPETGEIGVAVQSRIVGVGAIVPYAAAGIGAIATQALANPRYGPVGLSALSHGIPPEEVLALLSSQDPLRERRQAAAIDPAGRAAAYTGNECLDWAGSRVGRNYAAQGNILAGAEVVAAMGEAFESGGGSLSSRLLGALRAGQEAGGDRRGMQSAALLVVREGWGYGGGNDRYRDLRVDEHDSPIEELARVLEAHRRLFARPE